MTAASAGLAGGTEAPRPAQRLKVVLYNPRAVFFTMPLALLAIGSELDPDLYEVVIIDGRFEPDVEKAIRSHIVGALCLGVTVLTGAPISDALQVSRIAKSARAEAFAALREGRALDGLADCGFERRDHRPRRALGHSDPAPGFERDFEPLLGTEL